MSALLGLVFLIGLAVMILFYCLMLYIGKDQT